MSDQNTILRDGLRGLAASIALTLAGTALATTVPVTNGPLYNTVSTVAYGTASYSGPANPNGGGNTGANSGFISGLAIPGSYTYSDAFSSNQTGHPVAGTSNGFYDDWVFAVDAATVNTVTSTIALTNALQIQGLSVELFNCASNNCSAPVTGTPAGTYWTATTLVNGNGVTVEQISAVGLAQGTYAIQVTGTATGGTGGSYSGNLNVDLPPVPVPGSLSLLAGGLALVAGVARRRRV